MCVITIRGVFIGEDRGVIYVRILMCVLKPGFNNSVLSNGVKTVIRTR